MTEQSPQFQLDKLCHTIASLCEQGDNPAFKVVLDERLSRESVLMAKSQSLSTVVQGGERSVIGATVGRDIITKDNTIVNRILNLYLGKDDDATDKSAPHRQAVRHQTDETTLRRRSPTT